MCSSAAIPATFPATCRKRCFGHSLANAFLLLFLTPKIFLKPAFGLSGPRSGRSLPTKLPVNCYLCRL